MDPHRNLFYYYRGPSSQSSKDDKYDVQVENNVTKSFINILEILEKGENPNLRNWFLNRINLRTSPLIDFDFQTVSSESIPDAVITLEGRKIYIESKVRAELSSSQIKRHLSKLMKEDVLLIITNHNDANEQMRDVVDSRLRFVTWSQIHQACSKITADIKHDKKARFVFILMKEFIYYLEVVAMTDFTGLNNDDFDYFINKNQYYKAIIKNKMGALSEKIREKLPTDLKHFSEIKIGNIRDNDNSLWVAFRDANANGPTNQCNFTVDITSEYYGIRAVIRNGRVHEENTAVGIFYKNLTESPAKFIDLMKSIRPDYKMLIWERCPRDGKRIKPGGEVWKKVLELRLDYIQNTDDISYIKQVLERIKKPNSPGIHITREIKRGNELLLEPNILIDETISTMQILKPVLDFLER